MKELGLIFIIVKKFKHYTTKVDIVEKDNILSKDFSITRINENRYEILHIYIQLKMVGVI